MINYQIWCFCSFFHFLLFNSPNNKCHKLKWRVLFFTRIKLVARVLACARDRMHQIEKTAVGPEKLVSDNKHVFSNCEKYIVLWAGKICWVTCFHLYSPNIRLQKEKNSRQHFQKVSRTLYCFHCWL